MKKLYAFYLLLFSITMYAQPNIGTLQDLYACDENNDGFATFDLTIQTDSIMANVNSEDFNSVAYYYDMNAYLAGNALAYVYTNQVQVAQTIIAVISDENGDTIKEFDLIVSSTFEVESIVSVGYDFVITLSTPGLYQYTVVAAPDGAPVVLPFAQESNTFTDMPFGQYSLMIENGCGNAVTITFEHMLTAPVGEAIQTFTEGQTLADLEVEGENIQWYATETGDNPLAITTPLVNGTTYYAAQSIDGIESTLRLAVTVNLVLGIDENKLTTLSYYPNPVVNNLTISNNTTIDEVAVYNSLGQQVLTTSPVSTEATVNFSLLSSGVYFVKVQSGAAQKTIRIAKQ